MAVQGLELSKDVELELRSEGDTSTDSNTAQAHLEKTTGVS